MPDADWRRRRPSEVRTWVKLRTFGAMIIFSTAGIAPASVTFAQTPAFPAEGEGKDKFAAACGGCHEATVVTGQHHDLEGWSAIVDRMVDHGAQITDADYKSITEYLARHY